MAQPSQHTHPSRGISLIARLLALPALLLSACTAFSDLPSAPLQEPEGEPEATPEGVPEGAPEGVPEPEPEACPPDLQRCEGACVEVDTLARCGGCLPCVPGPNSVAVACDQGACAFECAPNFLDLNGDLQRGLEGGGCECLPSEEVCDGVDNDCDGQLDEGVLNACGGCLPLGGDPGQPCGQCGALQCQGGDALDCVDPDPAPFFIDRDGDRFGQGDPRLLCAPEAPHTAPEGGDCDDRDPRRHPGADEVCDEIDNNCDGLRDEGVLNACGGCGPLDGAPGQPCGICGQLACDGPERVACQESLQNYFSDADADGFGAFDSRFRTLCAPDPPFTAPRAGDCGDLNPDIHPDADEICDGLYNDCNAAVDTNDPNFIEPTCALDEGVCALTSATCAGGALLICQDADYAAAASAAGQTFEPGLEILCDGFDNDCDGADDENCCPSPPDALRPVSPPEGPRRVTPSIALGGQGRIAATTWLETSSGDRALIGVPDGLARMARLDLSGQLLAPIVDADGPLPHGFPRTAAHAEGFDHVYIASHGTANASIRWARSSHDGELLVQETLQQGQEISELALASRQDGAALVTWLEDDFGRLMSRAIQPGGDLSEIHQMNTLGASNIVAAVSETSGLVVYLVRQLTPGIKWRMLDLDLEPTGQNNTLSDSDATGLIAVAPFREGFTVAYVRTENDRDRIQSFRIREDGGRRGGTITLSNRLSAIESLQMIPDGARGVLVVWSERRDALSFFMVRLDNNGEPAFAPVEIDLGEHHFSARPMSLAAIGDDPSPRWFALALSGSATEDVLATPDRLSLAIIGLDGLPRCFSE